MHVYHLCKAAEEHVWKGWYAIKKWTQHLQERHERLMKHLDQYIALYLFLERESRFYLLTLLGIRSQSSCSVTALNLALGQKVPIILVHMEGRRAEWALTFPTTSYPCFFQMASLKVDMLQRCLYAQYWSLGLIAGYRCCFWSKLNFWAKLKFL